MLYYIYNFYQSFLSQTLTIHRTAGEERGSSFVSLYFTPAHEHSDIICNFACEMTITYY